jgi:hypothetical protein
MMHVTEEIAALLVDMDTRTALHCWSLPHSELPPARLVSPVLRTPPTVPPATARKLVLCHLTRFLYVLKGGVDTMGPEIFPIIGATFFHFYFLASRSAPSCRGAPDFGELFQKDAGYKRRSRLGARNTGIDCNGVTVSDAIVHRGRDAPGSERPR